MNKNTDILKEKIPTKDEDVFDFDDISESVAETIKNNESPFVYGIIGSWGSGKSSFLNFLVDHLLTPDETKNKSAVVYFKDGYGDRRNKKRKKLTNSRIHAILFMSDERTFIVHQAFGTFY